MSPRLWLLLFVLTLAIGVTSWMSGAKTSKPPEEEAVPSLAEEKKPDAPVAPPPVVEPEPLPIPSEKKGLANDKPNDSKGLPAPSEHVPNYEAETTKPPATAQPPNPDDPYNNAPVDGGPGNLSGNPPTSYPPPAYPPPVYPDGGFEGDVPGPASDPNEANPDGLGDGAPPSDEGF